MSTTAYVIGALVMGAICMGLASWKGRRTWLWGLLGLVFGVITLIVLVFMPSVKKRQLA